MVEKIQGLVEDYKFEYVVSFENIRAGPFKLLAHKLKSDSKFFLGKNKVVQVALGKSPETECADNLHLLSQYMRGQVCLVLSNKTKEQLEKVFADEAETVEDFATAGTKASYTVHLKKGTDALDGYGHAMEPYLKQLGLPTKLNFQKIELLNDVYVCREGQPINVE